MFYGTIHRFGFSVSLLLSLDPEDRRMVEGEAELAPVFRYVTKDRGERLQAFRGG